MALVLAAVSLLGLAGCATPAPPPQPITRVVLLPQADGTPSAVVLRTGDVEKRLDEPYSRASGRAGEAPVVDAVQPQDVKREFAPLFSTAPPPLERFVVYFKTGTTVLTAESARTIGDVLDRAIAREGAEIVVIGHTDTQGDGVMNDRLSLRRAMEVRDMFGARKFPTQRLEAVGRGERDLAVPTRDNVNEPRNRRVEILVR